MYPLIITNNTKYNIAVASNISNLIIIELEQGKLQWDKTSNSHLTNSPIDVSYSQHLIPQLNELEHISIERSTTFTSHKLSTNNIL